MVKKPISDERVVRETPPVEKSDAVRDPRPKLDLQPLEERLAPESEWPPTWPF
jgi:hypothetical protein